MIFLAKFVLKGYSQAALVAASMAILGMLFPPAAWVSSAAIALVVLVMGPQRGLITALLALLGSAVFSLLIFAAPEAALIYLLLAWLPVWIAASVLRQSVSLTYSLQVLAAMSLMAVVMLYTFAPGLGEHWRPIMDQMLEQMTQQSAEISKADLQKTEDWLIAFLPALMVAGLMFGAMMSLFLARWWQAVLYNPGGFGREFRTLDMGKVSALIALVMLLAAAGVEDTMVQGMATVIMMLYSIQALSLIHAAVNIRRINSVWLVVIYILLFFMPQVLLIFVLLALADPWLDFRGRLAGVQ